MAVRVLTAKLSEELIDELSSIAVERGTTRNALVREALEAIIDNRVTPLDPEVRLARELRAGFARDRDRLRALASRHLDAS